MSNTSNTVVSLNITPKRKVNFHVHGWLQNGETGMMPITWYWKDTAGDGNGIFTDFEGEFRCTASNADERVGIAKGVEA